MKNKLKKAILKWNKSFLLLFSFSICNLLYMHYYIFSTCNIEAPTDITSFFDNLTSIMIEITLLYACYSLILWKKVGYSLTFTFITTLIWAFSNILYSRFFLRYITFSSIGQIGNIFDYAIFECIVDGIKWTDIYFPFMSIFYIILYKILKISQIKSNYIINLLTLSSLSLVIDLIIHVLFCATNSQLRYISYYTQRVYANHIIIDHNLGRPNWSNFHRGSVRTLIAEQIIMYGNNINLEKEQIVQIQKVIRDRETIGHIKTNSHIKNIVFILVESYVSFTTDLIIEGKEIMPFLNSLRNEPNVYYNGKMHSNITLGQSSDGQFIYMSGLLPLRPVITISKAKNVAIPGLPKLLSRKEKGMKSRMVIPTLPSLWEQEAMCISYGFDKLYSSNDYPKDHNRNLSDEEVFEFASTIDKKSEEPFFSIILTMAMHSPYNKIYDPSFNINDKKYDEDFKCYLNACHYTDKQIKNYFKSLKENGLYDKSLIIIASDHQVLEKFLNVEKYGYNRNLPLFIINGNLEGKEYENECNQIDVYPTILDIMGISGEWNGLGKSIISPNYSPIIEPKLWNISEWILFGDYFNTHSF